MRINRRRFLTGGAAMLAGMSAAYATSSDSFRFAVISDTHIIDSMYRGPEGSPEDTESIFQTERRLKAVRTYLSQPELRIEHVFLTGDYFHNYPSTELSYYFRNRTRLDIAKELTDGFAMPVHAGFGNHDYDVPRVPRQVSHELFRRKFGLNPYYSVTLHGRKFIMLNNFLGDTWKAGDARYNHSVGSFGEEQLNWFESELQQHTDAFVFFHYPLSAIATDEKAGYGLLPILKKYEGSIQRVISGHVHKWTDCGRKYGPPHMTIASTRYDENAYLLVEVDRKTGEHRLLNQDLLRWGTHFSEPFRPNSSN